MAVLRRGAEAPQDGGTLNKRRKMPQSHASLRAAAAWLEHVVDTLNALTQIHQRWFSLLPQPFIQSIRPHSLCELLLSWFLMHNPMHQSYGNICSYCLASLDAWPVCRGPQASVLRALIVKNRRRTIPTLCTLMNFRLRVDLRVVEALSSSYSLEHHVNQHGRYSVPDMMQAAHALLRNSLCDCVFVATPLRNLQHHCAIHSLKCNTAPI